MLKEKMRWIYFSDMLDDEYKECIQEGKEVERFRSEIENIKSMRDDRARENAARQLLLAMERTPVTDSFPYIEPDEYEKIASLLPSEAKQKYNVDSSALAEHIRGAWQGRIAGCVLGIPV